jgi:hypothetical protein
MPVAVRAGLAGAVVMEGGVVDDGAVWAKTGTESKVAVAVKVMNFSIETLL